LANRDDDENKMATLNLNVGCGICENLLRAENNVDFFKAE
jgi:hypothetical protein